MCLFCKLDIRCTFQPYILFAFGFVVNVNVNIMFLQQTPCAQKVVLHRTTVPIINRQELVQPIDHNINNINKHRLCMNKRSPPSSPDDLKRSRVDASEDSGDVGIVEQQQYDCRQLLDGNAGEDDTKISNLTRRLNIHGHERSKGALDVHGIHDSDCVGIVDSDGNDLTQEFLDMMETSIDHIVALKPGCGLARAMSIDREYVLAQRGLFLRSAPSPMLQYPTEGLSHTNQGSEDRHGSRKLPSQSWLSPSSSTAEGPNELASRMEDHFGMKYEYFGERCLGREITLSDLTADDRKIWNNGYTQVLSDKDSAGRVVTISFPQLQRDVPLPTMMRIYMYMYQTLTKDVDVQKNGYIHVTYAAGTNGLGDCFTENTDEAVQEISRLFHSIPLRCRARHMVYSHAKFDSVLDRITQHMSIYLACRYRPHFVSSHDQALMILPTFGIPRKAIPICQLDPDGTSLTEEENRRGIDDVVLLEDDFAQEPSFKADSDDSNKIMYKRRYYLETDFHLGFLEAIEKHEIEQHQSRARHPGDQSQVQSQSTNSNHKITSQMADDTKAKALNSTQAKTETNPTVVVPGPMDVELGRGAIYQNRTKPGYLRYRYILDDEFVRYEQTDRQDRADVVSDILRRLDDAGIRFVRPQHRAVAQPADDDGDGSQIEDEERRSSFCWEIVSPAVVREKITHDFRNQRKSIVSSPTFPS